jgi:hypothetical protein
VLLGAEAIFWILRHHLDKDGVVVCLDEEHAFQVIDRNVAVKRTLDVCSASVNMMPMSINILLSFTSRVQMARLFSCDQKRE